MRLAYVLIALCAFAGMELFAWATHRYLMHGRWGWGWHASHHVEPIGGGHERRGFELNDLFAVVFAAPAVLLFWLGSHPGWGAATAAAVGVTGYGVMYGVVHDGLVHHRWPFRLTPRRGYAKRLVQAHRLHHSTLGREGAVSFGFLYAPEVRKLKALLQRRGVDAG
ncbi:MAG: sterol desaturase family protein [Caulobacteraceae bacterium]|nr:sterol desaturase family protein [Caulobacter sp.]